MTQVWEASYPHLADEETWAQVAGRACFKSYSHERWRQQRDLGTLGVQAEMQSQALLFTPAQAIGTVPSFGHGVGLLFCARKARSVQLGNTYQTLLENPKSRTPRWPGDCPGGSCSLTHTQGLAGAHVCIS